MKKLVAVVILAFILVNASFVFAQDADKDFKDLYRTGIEQVKTGHYKEAYESFNKALLLKPSSDLVRFLIQETGDLILKDMLANLELHETAIRILELGKGAFQRLQKSPEEIQKIVAALDGPFDKRWEAINMLAAIGQNATPYLVDRLADKSDETRSNTMLALDKIGSEAVLPLLEVLQSGDVLVRQNAVIVLGVVRDERAVAELKRVCEDANESPEVKRYAMEALTKITKLEYNQMKSAKEYYFDLAEKYYYQHPSVMINFYGEYVIWKWNPDTNKLTMKEVPDFLFADLLAEKACYAGLKLDRNYEPLWSLLACVLFSKYDRSELALQNALKKSKTGEITAEMLTKLQNDLAKNSDNLITASLIGKQFFYAALERSLKDNRAEVAVSCIKALANSADFSDLPTMPTGKKEKEAPVAALGTPLVNALSSLDQRVRFAAAQTLLKINPPAAYPDIEKVMPLINEALGESGERVALIIDPNPEVRSYLQTELSKLNIFVKQTLSAADGLKAAKAFPTEDIILINSRLANEVVFSVDILGKNYSETVYNSLREDIRTKGIPIIMMESKDEIEKAKNIYQDKVDGYLTTPFDRTVLADTINKALTRDDIQADSKSRALMVCQETAEVLANLDLNNTVYNYAQAINYLVGDLEKRPDEIRMLALTALGRFANPAAIEGLKKALTNKENSLPIRTKTAESLANILRNKPASIDQDAYEVLKKSLTEDEVEVKRFVAIALGNAKLTLAQRKELAELKRPALPSE